MPSGFLHQLCAQRACALSGVTPVETDVMTLGAQGPDPLFTIGLLPLRLSSKPGKLGNTLHERRTGAFLCALCRKAKEGDAVDRAYALGFLTHYALDSTVHPFVYAHSHRADGSYSSSLHMRLEKRWDVLYYRREGHTGTPVIMPGPKETRAHWPQIAALLYAAIHETFPEEDLSEAVLLGALSDTERVNRLTHSPRGIKYGLVWVLERLIGKPRLATSQMVPPGPGRGDIENEAHASWYSPFEPERARSEGLSELYERGVRRAGELLTAAAKYFGGEISGAALAEIVGNAGYDSGMESKL